MRTAIRGLFVLALLVTCGSAAPRQTPATGRVMREKLTHSQRILEAIMISDYALLERESAALSRATEAPGWSVLKSPEYLRQSDAFVRATRDLVDAAKQRDLDAAAMHYVSLTLSCYQCHRYLKNARIALR
jgi:hypothetical protein